MDPLYIFKNRANSHRYVGSAAAADVKMICAAANLRLCAPAPRRYLQHELKLLPDAGGMRAGF